MEWTETLRSAISYMESHMEDAVTAEDVAAHVHLSPFYLQKGFEVVTGYSVAKYLRCRRLYLAALDLAQKGEKVIDVAYRYGFETPESFTKAFARFHGATPTQIRRDPRKIKPFLPLKIAVSVVGGEALEYTVEEEEAFTVIGISREFSFDSGYAEVPGFWDEFNTKYFSAGGSEAPQLEAVLRHGIGEFGVCIDENCAPGTFRYLIAGRYRGGEVPEGMELYRFPALAWAKFPCCGPLPGALQARNAQIFQEWLPGNTEYCTAMDCTVEWYSEDDSSSPDCRSAIWLPVKKL